MNTRKSKKGFTIVELVIVIAVIAILAAVLIPTFANLIRQANKSSDTQLVKNMNTILSAAEALNGKNETMADALQDILDAGYSVEKLTPTTEKCHIVWNQKTDRMIFLDENFEVEYPKDEKIDDTNDIWMVVGDKAALDAYQANYSIYLTEDFKEETVKVAHGLDVGSCKTIKTVECVNESYAGTILINMAGGNLTVNAPKATVNHYGDAALVEIEAVANASYHENGNVDEIRLKAGRVVVESKGNVAGVRIVADAISDGENGKKNVSVEVAAGGKLGAVGATNSTVAADLKNIVSGSTDVIESPVEVTNDFAGGFGTENSPYLIATNEHLKNIIQGTADNKLYYKLIADIEASSEGGNYVVRNLAYSEFDGANHTVTITDKSRMFSNVSCSEIKNLKAFIENNLVLDAANTTFNNVDLFGKINTTGGNEGVYVVYADPMGKEATLTYIDCDCSVDFTSDGTASSYNSVFTGYAYANITTLNYTNCTYSGTFISGKAAMFLGNNSANNSNVTINVNNCENKGIIQATLTDKGYYWNSYVATGIKNDLDNNSFKANSVTLNGVKLTADNIAEPMGTGFIQGPNDANLKLVLNADGTFTVIASENLKVSYYEVSVGLYSKWNDGGTLVQYVKEKLDKSSFNNGTKTTTLKKFAFVDKAWVDANSDATAKTYGEGDYAYTVYTLDGNDYYYLPDFTNANLGGEVKDAQIISVSCFDANGNLISSATLSK